MTRFRAIGPRSSPRGATVAGKTARATRQARLSECRSTSRCGKLRIARVIAGSRSCSTPNLTCRCPAYLLVPHDRKAPGTAVLAVHGHGPGKDLVCGPATTEAPNGDYAHRLALAGYVVLAPDLRCFGERADWNPPDHYGCDTNLVHTFMAGQSPLAQNLWDMAGASTSWRAIHSSTPPRIAVAGLSYGGTISLFLAAMDERVSVAIVSCYMSSWAEAHKLPWNMCGSQVLPGMLGKLEHVDLGALVAPRPMLVESGVDDDVFPIAAATKTVGEVRQVYEALGAEPERVRP